MVIKNSGIERIPFLKIKQIGIDRTKREGYFLSER